jgi:hypothetical protein
MAEPIDYEQEYESLWRKIVENPDGTLNADQVKRELFDYSELMKRATEVYASVTGGMISKPETMAHHVIDQANRRRDEAYDEAINDLIKSLEMDPDEEFASVAEVVALIRELTGVSR